MADILVIDDEDNLSYSLQLALKRAGHSCRVADTLKAGLAECERQPPDLVLLDMQLPDGNGIDLMAHLRKEGFDIPTIVITAFGTVASAVAAMKQGAADFIQKPLSMEEVGLAVDRCLENRRIRNRLDAFQEAQRRESEDIQIIGSCPEIQKALSVARKIASVATESGTALPTTLILGETGTGKGMVARYIHNHGLRPDRPFIQVNCTAIPENLFEAELFGHEKGSFTDAKVTRKGLFETAHEGTLFLDEIGDMPIATQAKLLDAIERGRYRRIGASNERVADVRIIAATNSDLLSKIQQQTFRADLFYRLKGFTIELPPLRSRGDDLFLLTDHFLKVSCRKFHKAVPQVPTPTLEVMKRYPWPGNVRELANVLLRAVLLHDHPQLEPATLGIGEVATSLPQAAKEPLFDFTGDCSLATVEKQLIKSVLEHTHNNVSEAARLLGLTRGGLRHKMVKLGL